MTREKRYLKKNSMKSAKTIGYTLVKVRIRYHFYIYFWGETGDLFPKFNHVQDVGFPKEISIELYD